MYTILSTYVYVILLVLLILILITDVFTTIYFVIYPFSGTQKRSASSNTCRMAFSCFKRRHTRPCPEVSGKGPECVFHLLKGARDPQWVAKILEPKVLHYLPQSPWPQISRLLWLDLVVAFPINLTKLQDRSYLLSCKNFTSTSITKSTTAHSDHFTGW